MPAREAACRAACVKGKCALCHGEFGEADGASRLAAQNEAYLAKQLGFFDGAAHGSMTRMARR
jgi:cytochrome c553